MAKGRAGDGNGSDESSSSNDGINPSCPNNQSLGTSATVNTPRRASVRSKPYEPNNSFIKKVTSKVSDFIPQNSWISKWINTSQDEKESQNMEAENSQSESYEEKQFHQPPAKRARIRMDVIHPPGTFAIKSRDRKVSTQVESKDLFSNHNDTTQDFLEPTAASFDKVPRLVSSTPAFPVRTNKSSESRSALNMLMTEENNAAANGADDNSETSESTSGCSSLIPQNGQQDRQSGINYHSPFGKRRYTNEKFDLSSFLPSSRSLLLDGISRDTLAKRQPSFNPSLVNSSALERSSSLSSPFYMGNTMFGGANAANLYRSNSVVSEPSQLRPPTRTSVEVNTSNEASKSDLSGMSTTARRILETIEQFSSPISDAKKIPVRDVMGSNRSTSNSSLLSQMTLNASRKRQHEDNSPRVGFRHLARELVIPTRPDLLRLRRHQRLQNTTMNARKIANARNISTPHTPIPEKYHIRSEEEEEPKRPKNSLKARKNIEEEDTVEPVNLPAIVLPISNLPRFDISLPKPFSAASSDKQQTPSANKDDSFKFASPIKLPNEENNLKSFSNFVFSRPISPSKVSSTLNESMELSKTLSVDSNDSICTQDSMPNFVWSGSSKSPVKPKDKIKAQDEAEPKGPKVASELKTGSVMDYFSKTSSSSSTITISDTLDVWECSECLIKNNSKETHCVACKSSKLKVSSDVICIDDDSDEPEIIMTVENNKLRKTSTKIHGSSVTPNPSSIIFGKLDSISQSESTKIPTLNSTNSVPDKSVSETMFKFSNDQSSKLSTTLSGSKSSSTSNAFKVDKSSWECPCCMVQNTQNATTCPCCNTAKPGSISTSPKNTIGSTISTSTSFSTGFGDKFKKPENSWTCEICMINNKSDAAKCAACGTQKPGAVMSSNSSALSSSSSGVFTTANSFGDTFKTPEGSWICDACMLNNKPDTIKCVACETPKTGGAAETTPKLQFKCDKPASTSSFKFGIDKADEVSTKSDNAALKSSSKTNGFTFGSSTSSTSSASATNFSFGVPSAVTDKNKPANSNPMQSVAGGFVFKPSSDSVASAATFQFGAKPTTKDSQEEGKSVASTATFSFGTPAKTDIKLPTGGFVFGSPISTSTDKKNEEKKDKDEPKPASSAVFTFGITAATAPQTNKDTASDDKSKPASETPVASDTVFGSSKPASSFQSKVETTPKPVVSESEASKSTTETSQTTANFSFGSNLSKENPSPFAFGVQSGKTVPTTTTPSLPVFSFGKPVETTTAAVPAPSTSQQAENKTAVLTFGSPAVSTFGQTNQTTVSIFGGTNATPGPAASTSSTESKSIFGVPDNKTAPSFSETNPKTPKFGTTSTENKPATETSIFGTITPNSSPFGSSSSTFGSGSGSSATPNLFSTTKPLETTTAASATSGIFTFGQSSKTPASTTGGFNFSAGSNATVTSNDNTTNNDQKGIFTFGAASNSSVNNGSFGGSSTFSATPAATPNFTFNAPKPATSTFGGANTPAPMFNSPAVVPNALTPSTSGFNFGSTSVPGSFSFGSATAPTTGTFNFNAPVGSAPPTFDPNSTFNFTTGSGSSAPPARKIKKAVRRMPRQ
ncbi:nuclear pore complex protein Nup153 [Copidosoma floridanum]|uniref:nuclear pore complex protein Nup153 n=1 Tax=Copidosoma floridanum TaxID=29053 RepID=UPI0006C95662|nr:nuclear pore complex protein Nup153 [Copidosoma floridanum]